MYNPLIEIIIVYAIPIIFILCGVIYINHPPKTIGFSGYKTGMAKQNKDTWKTAHNIFGKISILIGIIQLIVAICTVDHFLNQQESAAHAFFLLEMCFQLVLLGIGVMITEARLRMIFDNDGVRKQKKT
jgi:uncharacterized membrane protein